MVYRKQSERITSPDLKSTRLNNLLKTDESNTSSLRWEIMAESVEHSSQIIQPKLGNEKMDANFNKLKSTYIKLWKTSGKWSPRWKMD